jgi:hemoglobin
MNDVASESLEQEQKQNLPYARLGGEAGIKALCKAFYQRMDTLEEAKEIRAMHGESLEAIEEKLFEYLSGWLGGPHLYQDKYGTICLTSPHEGYKIDEKARDQWLLCMDKALEDVGANEKLKQMLEKPMYDIANFIRNC